MGACKLAEALQSRKDPDDDLQKINMHLERSNKPSSLVMMMLKDLKAGNAIDTNNLKPPAVGSVFHRREMQKQERNRSGSRKRRSSSRRQRVRSRSNRRHNDRGGGGGGGGGGRDWNRGGDWNSGDWNSGGWNSRGGDRGE